VVTMSSYAPLFAHAEAWQWTPDLIWFDNLRAYGTPNYYVQKLFSINKGTDLVPVFENGEAIKGKDSLYASSVWDRNAGEVVIKIVNPSATARPVNTTIKGAKAKTKEARIQELSSPDQQVVNNFESPRAIYPVESVVPVKNNNVALTLRPFSLTIIRVPCK
jgi:alpha-L-arabinofuranosidase